MSDQLARRRGHQFGRLPRGIVEARFAPAREFLARVVVFAIEFAVGGDRAVGAQLPRAVTDDVRDTAVGVFDAQLEQQLGKAVADGAALDLAAVGVIPSVAEHHAEGVRAAAQLPGHVVRDVMHTLGVIAQGR